MKRKTGDVGEPGAGLAKVARQFCGLHELSEVVRSLRNPAQNVFGADLGKYQGSKRPVECREDDEAARPHAADTGIDEGLPVCDMLDDLQCHHGIEGGPAGCQVLEGAFPPVDNKARTFRVAAGHGDGLGRSIDPRHVAAQPGERVGDQPAAASCIDDLQSLEGPCEIAVEFEVGDELRAKVRKAHGVETVEHPERPRLVPPLIGKDREGADFLRIDGRAPAQGVEHVPVFGLWPAVASAAAGRMAVPAQQSAGPGWRRTEVPGKICCGVPVGHLLASRGFPEYVGPT